MKKKLNIIFFGLCFLGSVITEAYFMEAGEGNLFNIIALGIVILITGYLLMDSIRSKLSDSGKEIQKYIDKMYLEETVRLNERYNELLNLQKATYTATKKNTAAISEQLEKLIDRVDSMEGNNAKALQMLTDLQMKALEGQKKSLSLEVNYNKENTGQLMKAISESGNQAETIELLGRIADQIKDSTQVLQQELQNMSITVQAPSVSNQYSENSWNINTEPRVENLTETGWEVDAEIELGAKVSGWNSDADTLPEEENIGWNSSVELEATELSNGWSTSAVQEESSSEEAISKLEAEEPISQVKEIKPLYEDANKALSADEIAALFASFGQ